MAIATVAAATLSTVAVVVALSAPEGRDRAFVGLVHALLIATPVAVGLYALGREPDSRFARLLIGAGFLWAPSLLAASGGSLGYSVGRVASWFVVASLIPLVLAFPSGRISGRVERGIALAAPILLVVFYLPTALVDTHYPFPSPWSACRHACPENAFAVTESQPRFVGSFVNPAREVAAVILFLAAAAAITVRTARASRLMRRTLTPVLAGSVVALGAAAAFLVARRADQWSSTAGILGYVAVLAVPGLVLGFLIGLVRWRFVATAALRRLSREFERASSGPEVRSLIAEVTGDESLEVAYWTGHPGHWVDDSGRPVTLPRSDPARAITEIASHGQPVAALVHDPAHIGEPSVREVAGGFALMALENRRLDAELRSSLRELRESRARILSAVDLERQRIERDLHDGAQQRLVALRVAAEVAADAVERDPGTASALLTKLGTDLEKTLDEVRSLARGVYPPLLADHGIGEALRIAARGSTLPTRLRSRGLGRYSQQIESAVYFCCLEALQNAAKHADAHSVTITLSEDEELRFEVHDDGRGFEQHGTRGAGLDNMRDRIASLGGRLTIESVPGEGTTLTGTVPVGLAQLTPDVEALLQRATDALDDCFAIYRAVRDSRGTIVDFTVEHLNDAACRDIGRSREAQVGRMLGFLDSDYLGSGLFAWHLQALEAEGPSVLDEVFYERSAASRRLQKAYEVRAVPLGAGRLAVMWREITERKRWEDELLLQSAVLNRAGEGVCLVRATDGVIAYANPRFEQIYGYRAGELDGRHVSVLDWPGEHSTRVGTPDQRGEASYEARHRRKDGTAVWCEIHVASFDHPQHGPVWVAVHKDVTGRRAAQDSLRESDQRMRAAVQAAPLGLYTMDLDLRYTWAFNNRVGLARDEDAVGHTDEELLGAAVAERVTRINQLALAGKRVRTELKVDLEDGPHTLDLSVGPLTNADGEIVGLAGAAYDLSARGRFTRVARRVSTPNVRREGQL